LLINLAAVEFRESSVDQVRVCVKLAGKLIDIAAKQIQAPRRIVFGLSASFENEIDASGSCDKRAYAQIR
jgi:hypothetical protein